MRKRKEKEETTGRELRRMHIPHEGRTKLGPRWRFAATPRGMIYLPRQEASSTSTLLEGEVGGVDSGISGDYRIGGWADRCGSQTLTTARLANLGRIQGRLKHTLIIFQWIEPLEQASKVVAG